MKQFVIILLIILVVQIPGWILILGREGGQINDFGNEGIIMIYDWAATFFSFPIYYFISGRLNNPGLALVVYWLDLFLISLIIHLLISGIKIYLRQRTETNSQENETRRH